MPNKPWPYPRWVAHRGAGFDAPENTLAAFRQGYEAGFRMFECDVKLSADGTAFLLHDATLDRTTNSKGPAHRLTWAELQGLDAGAWHSPSFAGERLITLEMLAAFCLANHCMLNIELKPNPGFERITGTRVAEVAQRLWRDSPVPPLLSSFDTKCLAAAKAAAPNLPRGLLVHKFNRRWRTKLTDLACVAVIFDQSRCNPAVVQELHSKDIRCGAFTVNQPARAQMLVEMGVDFIVTDEMKMPSLVSQA